MAGRLELVGGTSQAELFGLYARRVDVALDPFPYNGTVTTLEALAMGVPVVALVGDRFVGRVGLSLLAALGLPELAAADEAGYVAAAAGLAGDLEALAGLRAGPAGAAAGLAAGRWPALRPQPRGRTPPGLGCLVRGTPGRRQQCMTARLPSGASQGGGGRAVGPVDT